MKSLPQGFHALVLGAGGALGGAFVERLQADPCCDRVVPLGRHTAIAVDYDDEARLAQAAAQLRDQAPFHLIVVATGVLHTAAVQPEKRLADLSLGTMEAIFRINTFGPALVMRHFAPMLDRQRSVLAVLSAKVGSIGDNRLGGWYSYRASKAALNMVVRTAAIEMRRTHPGAVLAAMHPGTVKSALSRPFRGDEIGRAPLDAADAMLAALDGLTSDDSGCFLAYDGQRLPW